MTVFISYLFGAFSKIERPLFFSKSIVYVFSRIFKISFEDSVKKRNEFPSLYKMFTREVYRDLTGLSDEDLMTPVDGRLVSFGKVQEEKIFLVKGKSYSLKDLLGQSYERFKGHYFYNYYLSPKDYHRVHHPVTGVYKACYKIKGSLYPVAKWFVSLCPQVFSKNARTVSLIDSENYGEVAVVMVGALNVGSLEMSKGLFKEQSYKVKLGDHLGTFGLGSSVVLFGKGKAFESEDVKLGVCKFGDKF